MKVGDLVRCAAQKSEMQGKIGVITRLHRNSMNSSDKYTTFYVYWANLGCVGHASHSDLEVINERR